MELTPGQQLNGFRVQGAWPVKEINGNAYTLVHEKSGAKLLYLANDDNNKAFSIGFRTPPADDTGVFHILEHSVLCGSEKFPVKEPFVNLLKTSMQTFLNAMTFGDKTLYPVASTNEQDLINLADVYMDAVLHPNIYHKQAIFEQEGWHYEVEQGEDGSKQLVYNGVVYNEMKGALSDPASVLYDQLQKNLFPDTPYAFESGGTPESIPSLTYEHFLEEHTRHYRLDNSYITLYGNLDVTRMLSFLDTKYLSPVADEQAQRDEKRAADGLEPLKPRSIALQQPVEAKDVHYRMQTAKENSCMGIGYVIGTAHDRRKIIATDILIDAIMGSNEAPLKRVLLDAGIAGDAQAFVADSVLQPFVVLQLRSLKEGSERFSEIVNAELTRLAEGGLDHQLVEASLSRAEFLMREADYGCADGVALTMAALCGWLYDDSLAVTYLSYFEDFKALRQSIDTNYFEQLIQDVFLTSKHHAQVEIAPTDKDTSTQAQQLQEKSATLSIQEFSNIEEKVAQLRALQEEPDSAEGLAALPKLKLSDIGPAPAEPEYIATIDDECSVQCIYHKCPTNGIAYMYRYFTLSHINFEELPYVAVLGCVLGKLDTKLHSAAQIDTLTNGKLGNLSFFSEFYEDEADPEALKPMFVAGASALSNNIEWLASLPAEIMVFTDFSDTEKIKDILTQRKIAMEQSFANAGHAAAMAHLASYYMPAGVVRNQIGGVAFYNFLVELLNNFEDRKLELITILDDLQKRLFARKNMTASFAGSQEDYRAYWEKIKTIPSPEPTNTGELVVPAPCIKNEAFIVPSDVCYVACGFDRRSIGAAYSGTWQVATRALNFDYLWNEVRVKGGAYGAGFQAARTGTVRFYSYRDPHLRSTLERINGAPDWVSSHELGIEELEGYIVATIAAYDRPLKARALIRRQDGDYFGARTPENRIATRQEMLNTTQESIRALAKPIASILSKGAMCAFGNKEILETEGTSAGLTVIDLLNAGQQE